MYPGLSVAATAADVLEEFNQPFVERRVAFSSSNSVGGSLGDDADEVDDRLFDVLAPEVHLEGQWHDPYDDVTDSFNNVEDDAEEFFTPRGFDSP